MKRPNLWGVVASLALLAAGCSPTLDDRPWLVTRSQVVGVLASPPETSPGAEVAFQAVILDPTGAFDGSTTTWSLCNTPKPPAEANVVAPDCLAPTTPDAAGNPTALAIPTDACELFGPDVPQPAPGEPAARPADPDATGGYYQPVVIGLGDSTAVGLERVTCDLPQASLDVAREFRSAYRPNQNPTIAALALSVNGADATTSGVPPGASVAVSVSWLAGSAETFALFDRAASTVVEAQESLTTSWFVTGGELDRAASTTSDPAVLSATATWTVPATPGTWQLAVVLRDSRGGMDALTTSIQVTGR